MSGNLAAEVELLNTNELIELTNELSLDLKLKWSELRRAQSDIKDPKVKPKPEEQTIISQLLDTITKLEQHLKLQQSVIDRQNIKLRERAANNNCNNSDSNNNNNNNGTTNSIVNVLENLDGKQYLNSKYFQMKHLMQSEISHRTKNQLYSGSSFPVLIKKIPRTEQQEMKAHRFSYSPGDLPAYAAENASMEVEVSQRVCTGKYPHFVPVIEIVADPHNYWIVSPFESGGDLFNWIVRTVNSTTAQIRPLVLQMVEGVNILHTSGYCHLDLSPENFLMCDNGKALRLIDFGAARKLLQRKDDLYPPPKRGEDRPGKDSYRAPEIQSKQLFNGPKADIWSLGVVIFTMLAGRTPWQLPEIKDKNFAKIYGHTRHSSSTDVNTKTNHEISTENTTVEQIENRSRSTEERYGHKSVRELLPKHLSYASRVDDSLIDLIDWMLTLSFRNRPSITEVLRHPWLSQNETSKESLETPHSIETEIKYQEMETKINDNRGSDLNNSYKTYLEPPSSLPSNINCSYDLMDCGFELDQNHFMENDNDNDNEDDNEPIKGLDEDD